MPGWSCHCNATATHIAPVRTQHAPVTGTSTYAGKSWGGHPRCDLAPLTTSFGTVGQWERQHLAMAATTSPEVVGGRPRCDLAPQSTSFGTLALRERQHLATAGSEHLHLPRNATARRAATLYRWVCSALGAPWRWTVPTRSGYSVPRLALGFFSGHSKPSRAFKSRGSLVLQMMYDASQSGFGSLCSSRR